jgi:hypothetical protein
VFWIPTGASLLIKVVSKSEILCHEDICAFLGLVVKKYKKIRKELIICRKEHFPMPLIFVVAAVSIFVFHAFSFLVASFDP